MKTVQECEKFKVLLADGREFIVDFFPFDSGALGITVVRGGEDTDDAPFVDIQVDFASSGSRVVGS